jgi:uncharacterized protein YaiE (UPF0345 family)
VVTVLGVEVGTTTETPGLSVTGIDVAASTVTFTVALPVAPPLSVAVNWKVYEPGRRFEAAVEAEFGETMVAAAPASCVHLYAVIVLPLAAVPKPESVTLFTGAMMVCADPALTVGLVGWVAAV